MIISTVQCNIGIVWVSAVNVKETDQEILNFLYNHSSSKEEMSSVY